MAQVWWTLQGLLAFIMLGAGAAKVSQSKEKMLEEPRMAWVEDYADATIKRIGILEILIAVGLVLPWWLDIAPTLTPIAALGVVAIQVGALVTHSRRRELRMVPINLGLIVLGLVVAIGRFADL